MKFQKTLINTRQPLSLKLNDYLIKQPNKYSLGYYEVGDKKFYSKLAAILYSQEVNGFPQWNFHNEVFASVDWQTEPLESVTELYTKRARQLREKYDYIVLYFSGGSDSRTMLETFLSNNIKVDEIYVQNIESVNLSLVHNGDAFEAGNHLAEIPEIVTPYLKKLSKYYPDIKITYHDWTKDMLESYNSSEWILRSSSRLSSNDLAKQNQYLGTDNFKNLYDAGKLVAHVQGVEKPKLHLIDNKWYIGFVDKSLSVGSSPGFEMQNFHNEEPFYWQPDVPELMVKQAHLIKNYFEANPELKQLFGKGKFTTTEGETKMLNIVKSLIYPNWDLSIRQSPKNAGSSIFNEKDRWFWDGHVDHKGVKIWKEGLKTINELVNPIWFNDNESIYSDIVGCFSPFYYIGDSVSTVENKNEVN